MHTCDALLFGNHNIECRNPQTGRDRMKGITKKSLAIVHVIFNPMHEIAGADCACSFFGRTS